MKQRDRYEVSYLAEAQFEPGSQRRVLKNKRGIKKKREMDQLERQELIRVYEEVLGIYDKDHRFTASDICRIHKMWLGNIYEWAGHYRQVNVNKDDFRFAASGQIHTLMNAFERNALRKHTPCRFDNRDQIVRSLALVHTELVLIHPFREGNGRIARLLADVMVTQAGLPLLDFGGIIGRKKKEYIRAVQVGLNRNYVPMEKIFESIIRRTLRIHARRL